MKTIGKLASQCLDEVQPMIKPGITTADIEEVIIEFQKKYNLKNSQHGFQGFPRYACIGKNEVVCHGIPSNKVILNEGDIVKVDVTFNLEGFHGDTARTFPVGEIDDDTKRLLFVTQEAFRIGICEVLPGKKISDIGAVIESYVIKNKMKIVKQFTGHGISTNMHESPVIRHYWDPAYDDEIFEPGMTFTIEPIVSLGNPNCYVLSDRWTYVTFDKSWSAQEEVTLGVTRNGIEVFTPHPLIK